MYQKNKGDVVDFSLNNRDLKILIADDEPTNRFIAKMALAKDGYQIVEATNGKEAIEIAKKENPDVILMDAVMPIMNGFEAIKYIKNDENLANIPILMVTALDSKEDKVKAFNSGANDYISKPFDMQELKLRVKSFAQMRHLYIQNIKARIDPYYKLPNIQSLREKVYTSIHPNGLFFQIRDFENITYLYGIEGTKIIILDLIEHIKKVCNIENNNIFVLSEDRFAVYWETEELFPLEKIKKYAKTLYKEIIKKLLVKNFFKVI